MGEDSSRNEAEEASLPACRTSGPYSSPGLVNYGPISRRTLGGSGPMPENIMIGMLTIMLMSALRYP